MDLVKKWPLTRQQHLDMYYYMVLNRGVEDQMVRMFRQNKILSGIYQSLGQESISVGNAFALEPNDWLAPMIRNIGALLVKGFTSRDIFTQHMARVTAPTKGKDSTSHFGDYKRRVVGPISMLGDLIPVMCGVAMAGRYLGQNIVALTWIGDGGSSTGAFHEGMGLAASQRAPLVLVIENNQWAYSTPVRRQVPMENLADRAKAYGVPSLIVDGNDVVAVYATTKEAVEMARRGEGPVIIEAKTMRMKGHAQHDPAEYVPKEMFEYWKARDPIALFEKYLTENKMWSEADKKKIHERVDAEVADGAQFAEDSPLPPPEMAEEGVYCDGPACHDMTPEWKRPIAEVTPPRSSVTPQWIADRLAQLDMWAGGNGASAKAAGGGGAATRASAAASSGNGKRAAEKNTKPARATAEKRKGEEVMANWGAGATATMAAADAKAGAAQVTFLEAIRQALFEEMERDPAVVLIGEDVGVYGGAFKVSAGLLERFGWERVIDTPIAETGIVGAAYGMSVMGLKPVAEMQFIDFIACAFNQITNFVAKAHYRGAAPAAMVIRGPSGGGQHSGPFHSQNPEMYFVHTPGLKVIYPSTPYDAKGLLKSAIRDPNPVIFIEHKWLYRRIKEELPAEEYTVPIGKAIVRRPGTDLTIVSYAAMMHHSLEAAAELAKEGIEAEVVDLRTLLPLDKDTVIASVKKTNKLLVVHEDTRTGGIAGEIAALVMEEAFDDLDGPVERVTSLDTPVPFAPTMEDYFLPNVKKIVEAARKLAKY